MKKLKFTAFFVTIVIIASILIALFYEPATFGIFKAISVPPDANFEPRVLLPLTGDLNFDEYPLDVVCDIWINGGGLSEKVSSPGGSYHAGSFNVRYGSAIHTVGSDSNFENETGFERYNNTALFCGLPHPELGQKLILEMQLYVSNLSGSSGFYLECPVIDKNGIINPGGFNAVGLSLGGTNVSSVIGKGTHLHSVLGWTPIGGRRISALPVSGLYRLEIEFREDGKEVATLYLNSVNVGALVLDQPLCDKLELQVWLDNYVAPVTFLPLGFGNLVKPETLVYKKISVRVEPIN